MNNFFTSGFDSINKVSKMLPSMMNFQSLASDALGDVIGQLGNQLGFSSDLCGLMVDTIVSFIQCQFPIQLPDIGNLGSSLNINLNLGNSCAGNALRDTIYSGHANELLEGLAQPIMSGSNGSLSGGTATFRTGQ